MPASSGSSRRIISSDGLIRNCLIRDRVEIASQGEIANSTLDGPIEGKPLRIFGKPQIFDSRISGSAWVFGDQVLENAHIVGGRHCGSSRLVDRRSSDRIVQMVRKVPLRFS